MEEVDELLERALLALAVVRPEGSEGRPAVLAPEDAEEVLEPAVGRPERVALDVEEDVARRGLRQQLEAALRRRLEQVIRVPPGHACAVLERGLVAQRLEGARRHARDLAVRRRGGELGERADARLLEPRNLVAAQARDEREVVVPLPLRLAAFAEVADRAVRDGQRVRLGRVGDELEEALPDAPVVGHEVAGPVGVAQPGPEQDVHERRLAPGDAGELLGVEAELEDVSRLRGAGELRVGRLVGAVRLPLEEVRDPAPPLVDEDALVDDVDAGGERLARSRRRRAPSRARRRARSRRCASRGRAARRGKRARARRPCAGSARPAGRQRPVGGACRARPPSRARSGASRRETPSGRTARRSAGHGHQRARTRIMRRTAQFEGSLPMALTRFSNILEKFPVSTLFCELVKST